MVDYDNVLVVYYDRVLVLCEHYYLPRKKGRIKPSI